jgi:YHS domain-containing protein
MVIDPVCGMRIEADDAAATAEYDGQTYYFCSQACQDVFEADPSVYGARSLTGAGSDHLTEEEVAQRAGMTTERLRELVDLGLLESEDGGFLRRDVMRARMVAVLESKGLDLEALASARLRASHAGVPGERRAAPPSD